MRITFESAKKSAFLAAVLGAFLALSFTAMPVAAQSSLTAIGHNFAESSPITNTTFIGNATSLSFPVSYNFLGTGGNDTFRMYGGNASGTFAATGVGANNFSITTGNPPTNSSGSFFSLVSGGYSHFDIIQDNNGTATFIIIGGSNCFLNDSSVGPVGSTIFSVVLGTNSTYNLGAQFAGNQTIINIVT